MPITASDLPGILSAVRRFHATVEAQPLDHYSREAYAGAPAVEAAQDALRQALDPGNQWGSRNHDVELSDLPTAAVEILARLWATIARDQVMGLTPPFFPRQRREWSLLLADAERILEAEAGPPTWSPPEKPGPFGLTLVPALRTARRGQGEVDFGRNRRAWDLFLRLCERPGGYWPAEGLETAVFKGVVDRQNLYAQVGRVRRIIAPLGLRVTSTPGKGYALEAEKNSLDLGEI